MVTTGLGKVLYCLGIFLLCVASLGITTSNASEMTLNGPSGTVSEGYFQLRFDAETPANVIIERAESERFEVVQSSYPPMGDFQQITLSGFANGTYYFRARNVNTGAVSNVVSVTVQHYSLVQAFSLFGIGAGIFLLLVVVILTSHAKRKETAHG